MNADLGQRGDYTSPYGQANNAPAQTSLTPSAYQEDGQLSVSGSALQMSQQKEQLEQLWKHIQNLQANEKKHQAEIAVLKARNIRLERSCAELKGFQAQIVSENLELVKGQGELADKLEPLLQNGSTSQVSLDGRPHQEKLSHSELITYLDSRQRVFFSELSSKCKEIDGQLERQDQQFSDFTSQLISFGAEVKQLKEGYSKQYTKAEKDMLSEQQKRET